MIKTVGELRAALEQYPDETPVEGWSWDTGENAPITGVNPCDEVEPVTADNPLQVNIGWAN